MFEKNHIFSRPCLQNTSGNRDLGRLPFWLSDRCAHDMYLGESSSPLSPAFQPPGVSRPANKLGC